MNQILIADADSEFRGNMARVLINEGYSVVEAASAEQAIAEGQRLHFDIILVDLDIPQAGGLQVMKSVQDTDPSVAIILIAGSSGREETARMMVNGAADYLKKPFSPRELLGKINSVLKRRTEARELAFLRHDRRVVYSFNDIIGQSKQMIAVVESLKKVAKTDATILLLGETGTGKEMLAGAVHYNSNRNTRPFIKVNCAALPETLLESELFGHEKGAFTGAHKQRIGRFEQAHLGTLFLDEIGDMSLFTQAKILRVLQEQEFERVGGTKTIKVDVRLIAATNQDLAAAIESNKFRQDLYYRLNVFSVTIPPLRERKEDILLLAHYFLKKYARQYGKSISGFTPEAESLLRNYYWPGNVRELENTVERAVLLVENNLIPADALSFLKGTSAEAGKSIYQFRLPPEGISLKDVEKQLILQALEMTQWVQKDAAKLLGLSRRAMNYRIEQYNITHPRWAKNK
ncbi:MAG: sigma-54 dependent transcriptional regulator [bacterium]|nr:sigma-54 dependent transcriptional regulator [bacterium]